MKVKNSKSTCQLSNIRLKDTHETHAAYAVKFSPNLIPVTVSSTKQIFSMKKRKAEFKIIYYIQIYFLSILQAKAKIHDPLLHSARLGTLSS